MAASVLTIGEKRAAAGYASLASASAGPASFDPDGLEPQRHELALEPTEPAVEGQEVPGVPFAKYRPDQPRAPKCTGMSSRGRHRITEMDDA